MTRVTAAQNKSRGADDERAVARLLGGQRHKADSGGPEDVAHDWLAIQVRGGKRLMTDPVRTGVDAARVAANGAAKLPVCVVVDRAGTRIRRFVVVELADFAAWHGLPPPEAGKDSPDPTAP